MKIRSVNITVLVLAGLVFSSLAFYVRAQNESGGISSVFVDSDQDGLTDSEEKLYGTNPQNPDSDEDSYSDGAEVRSGYNPLKPAPGDKIVSESYPDSTQVAGVENNSENPTNLTEQVAQKISQMTKDAGENDTVSLDDITSAVSEILDSQNQQTITLPEVTKDDINIKEQSFKGLSDKEILEKKKDDLVQYLVAIYYILSSNSPEPITSASNATSVFSSLATQITTAITLGNSSTLETLTQNSQKVVEQMREVEVPEDLADLHIKALRYALYAEQLKGNVDRTADDPIGDISRLFAIQAFTTSLLEFSSEAEEKMNDYGVSYEDTLSALEKSGINIPSGILSTDQEND